MCSLLLLDASVFTRRRPDVLIATSGPIAATGVRVCPSLSGVNHFAVAAAASTTTGYSLNRSRCWPICFARTTTHLTWVSSHY